MRQVTVKWYECSTDPPPLENDGEDWYDEGEITDEGERVFDDTDIDRDWPGEATFAQVIAKWLINEGASEFSSSFFHRGGWYMWPDAQMDMYTGVSTEMSYHITGLRWWEERALYEYVKGRGLSGRTH